MFSNKKFFKIFDSYNELKIPNIFCSCLIIVYISTILPHPIVAGINPSNLLLLITIMGSETTSKLPVVDLTKENLKPGSSSWQSTCNEIRLALEEYGCFVALYDLSSNFRKKVFDSLEELFDLPQETKMKNVNPKPAHGYMGKISAFPLHEGMGIEYATNPEECEKFTKLMWPEGNDQFW